MWLAKIQALKKKADQLLADKMFTESVAAFTKMNELIKQHVEEEVSMDVDSSKPSQSTLPTKDNLESEQLKEFLSVTVKKEKKKTQEIETIEMDIKLSRKKFEQEHAKKQRKLVDLIKERNNLNATISSTKNLLKKARSAKTDDVTKQIDSFLKNALGPNYKTQQKSNYSIAADNDDSILLAEDELKKEQHDEIVYADPIDVPEILTIETVADELPTNESAPRVIPRDGKQLKEYAETQCIRLSTSHNRRSEYKCKICHRTYKEKRYVLDHLYNKHFERTPYTCELCDLQLCSASSLRNHRKSLHSDLPPIVRKKRTNVADNENMNASSMEEETTTNEFDLDNDFNDDDDYEMKYEAEFLVDEQSLLPTPDKIDSSKNQTNSAPSVPPAPPSNKQQTTNVEYEKISVPPNMTLVEFAESKCIKVKQYHQCDVCHRYFKEKRLALDHLYMKHIGETPHVCYECDIQLCSAGSLRSHKKKLHGNSKISNPAIIRRLKSMKSKSRFKSFETESKEIILPEFVPDDDDDDDDNNDNSMMATNDKCKLRLNIPDDADIVEIAKQYCTKLPPPNESDQIKNNDHQCTICERIFRERQYAIAHIYRAHIGRSPFMCEICNHCTCSMRALKKHLQNHADGHEFGRKIKKDYFAPPQRQMPPEIVDAADGDKPMPLLFYCDTCSKGFNDKRCLLNHLYRHIDYTPYQCKMCPVKLMTMRSLYNHVQTLHSITLKPMKPRKKTEHKCPECEQIFHHASRLRDHITSKHSADPKPYKCQSCERGFVSKISLKHHFLRIHANYRPFQCDQCPKAFTRLCILKEHIKMSHQKIRPFVCERCGKAFLNSSSYKMHLRKAHTFEKRYKCDQCDRRFYVRRFLLTHLNSHTGERPYKCSQCDKCYQNPAYLRLHQQLHENIAKYPCRYCEKSFVQSMKRRFHERSTHKVVPIQWR